MIVHDNHVVHVVLQYVVGVRLRVRKMNFRELVVGKDGRTRVARVARGRTRSHVVITPTITT